MIIELLFIIVVVLIILINMLYRSVVKTTKGIKNGTGLSGFEIARILSSRLCDLEDPHIIKKNGKYLDHYNRERNTIKLSKEVFDGDDLYAAITAINISLETPKDKKMVLEGRKLNAFLVIASYIVIIIGALYTNTFIIYLGMTLFVLAFIIEFILMAMIIKTDEDLKKLNELIKENNLIKPAQEYADNAILLSLSRLATLPYSFINYFR